MSTSLLCHAFAIHGYQYVRTIFEEGTIVFMIAHSDHGLRFPDCNCRAVQKRGTVLRRFRAIPIGSTPVYIAGHTAR